MEDELYEEDDMQESITDLNRAIHNWNAYKNGAKTFNVYKYNDIRVEYVCDEKKGDGCIYQMDEIHVCRGDEIIAKHKPHLDPYVSFDKHILTMSSDGELWIYDLKNNKELVYKQGIVAFYQSTEVEEAEYKVEGNSRIPVKEDRIWITGDGCVWGLESDDIYFNLVLDYDLNVIKYNEDYGDDNTEQSDDYDPSYVYIIVGDDIVRMSRHDYFDYKLDPEDVEVFVIGKDGEEPHFEHNDKAQHIVDTNDLLQMETYDSLSHAQYWMSEDDL